MRARLRDLGIAVGYMEPGTNNAITDVPGVRVGHVTLSLDQPSVVRTGVTAVLASEAPYWEVGCFAGVHRFNGFGEMTGALWIDEAGILASPICLSSTFSLGVLRDTLLADPLRRELGEARFHQPVCAETNDSYLSDGLAAAVRPSHVLEAIDSATDGPVAEGCVGAGTGTMTFEFKSGIGTSSRRVTAGGSNFIVGALVQSNFGLREDLEINGVPVGRMIGEQVPLVKRREEGSIIILIATDAPLLPVQCKRLAQRAVIGLGRCGGRGGNTSGDIILAFSVGNYINPRSDEALEDVSFLNNSLLDGLFGATAEAVEEAILNALTAAETTFGKEGRVVHALPLDVLQELMGAEGRTS